MERYGLIKERKCFYFYLGAAIMAAYILAEMTGMSGNPGRIQLVMAAAFLMAAAAYFEEKRQGKREGRLERICVFLIVGGVILRIGYMLYTRCDVRGHDLWEIDRASGGHAGYILTLIETGKLPDTNFKQYYQQPFFYMMGALVSGLIRILLGGGTAYQLVDASKIVSCFASCAMLVTAWRWLSAVSCPEETKTAVTAVMAFHPAFFLTGGRVGPDSLAAFLMLLAFFHTWYWSQDPSWKNTIGLAIIYGFAMMTKISCGIMAVFTFLVFLCQLCQQRRQVRPLLLRYVVFGLISFPLGLWYGIRNYLKFGQSLNYVLPLLKDQSIYCGAHSLVQRFFSLDLVELLQTPYADPWSTHNYNFPVYMLKSALFGEFTYSGVPAFLPVLLLWLEVVLAGFLVLGVIDAAKRKEGRPWFLFLMTAGGLLYLSGSYFSFSYPFGCSMDFRYMTPLVFFGAVVAAEGEILRKQMFYGCVGLFCMFSAFMYLLID